MENLSSTVLYLRACHDHENPSEEVLHSEFLRHMTRFESAVHQKERQEAILDIIALSFVLLFAFFGRPSVC